VSGFPRPEESLFSGDRIVRRQTSRKGSRRTSGGRCHEAWVVVVCQNGEQVYQHVAGAWLANLTDVCPFPAVIPTAPFSSHASRRRRDVTLAPAAPPPPALDTPWDTAADTPAAINTPDNALAAADALSRRRTPGIGPFGSGTRHVRAPRLR
jgi:hypothetical protein